MLKSLIIFAEYLKFLLQINNCSSAEASLALFTATGFRENISSIGNLRLTKQIYRDENHEEIQKKHVETKKQTENINAKRIILISCTEFCF